jgi:DNA-binding transcriptional ArsR family regulator
MQSSREPSSSAFRALADGTRRDILRMLAARPMTSGDIASRYASSWPTISRHLAILRDAGLVSTQREGQEIYYELNTSVFQDLVQHLIDWVKPKERHDRATNAGVDRHKLRGRRRRLPENT